MDTGRGATLGALAVEVRLRVSDLLRVEVCSIFLILLINLGFSCACLENFLIF